MFRALALRIYSHLIYKFRSLLRKSHIYLGMRILFVTFLGAIVYAVRDPAAIGNDSPPNKKQTFSKYLLTGIYTVHSLIKPASLLP